MGPSSCGASQCFVLLLSQGSSCHLQLEGEIAKNSHNAGLAFGHCFYKRYMKSSLEKNCQSIVITWGSAYEKQCVGETKAQDLLNYWQKKLKEMWKFTKIFPKLFFNRSYENGKFCSKFTLSWLLFVVHVAIALEQYVEVKGICCMSLAEGSKQSATTLPPSPLQTGELLLHAGISWHQGVLEMVT